MLVAVPSEYSWFRSLVAFAFLGNVTRGHNPLMIYQLRKNHGWPSRAIGLPTSTMLSSRVIKGL
jgi:hypothetical protein